MSALLLLPISFLGFGFLSGLNWPLGIAIYLFHVIHLIYIVCSTSIAPSITVGSILFWLTTYCNMYGFSGLGAIGNTPLLCVYTTLFTLGRYVFPTLSSRFLGVSPGKLLVAYSGAVMISEYWFGVATKTGAFASLAGGLFRYETLTRAIAPLFGAPGLTWLVAFAAASFVLLLVRQRVLVPHHAARGLANPERGARWMQIIVAVAVIALLVVTDVRHAQPPQPSLRVGAVIADREAMPPHRAALQAQVKGQLFPHFEPSVTGIDMTEYEQRHVGPRLDSLFNATFQAVRLGGAKVVVWSEAAADVFSVRKAKHRTASTGTPVRLDSRRALFTRASQAARELDIYLVAPYAEFVVDPRDATRVLEAYNRMALFDVKGKPHVYTKRNLARGIEDFFTAGTGSLPTLDTRHGRLGFLLGQEALFPERVAELGRQGADVVLSPASDSSDLAPVNTYATQLRALENGFSFYRVTSHGHTAAFDAFGNQLAALTSFEYSRSGQEGTPIVALADLPARRDRVRLYPWTFGLLPGLITSHFIQMLSAALLQAIAPERLQARMRQRRALRAQR